MIAHVRTDGLLRPAKLKLLVLAYRTITGLAWPELEEPHELVPWLVQVSS
jgi:hypothetical protein